MPETAATSVSLDGLPRPRVKLIGTDGNAFALIGKTASALRRAGWTSQQVAAFQKEATGGDYDHLLTTCIKYVDID